MNSCLKVRTYKPIQKLEFCGKDTRHVHMDNYGDYFIIPPAGSAAYWTSLLYRSITVRSLVMPSASRAGKCEVFFQTSYFQSMIQRVLQS